MSSRDSVSHVHHRTKGASIVTYNATLSPKSSYLLGICVCTNPTLNSMATQF